MNHLMKLWQVIKKIYNYFLVEQITYKKHLLKYLK